jgi:annexin A7/11
MPVSTERYLGGVLQSGISDVLETHNNVVSVVLNHAENHAALTKTLFDIVDGQVRCLEFPYTKGTLFVNAIESKVKSTHYLLGLRGLILGPVGFDAWVLGDMLLRKKDFNLSAFIEILLDRPPEELRLLKATYTAMHKSNLAKDIDSCVLWIDYLRPLFKLALQRSPEPSLDCPQPVVQTAPTVGFAPDLVAMELWRATQAQDDTVLRNVFFDVMTRYPTSQLKEVSKSFKQQFGKKLTKVIKKAFMLEDEKALLHIARACKDDETAAQRRDAKLLYAAMKGMGTKDQDLVTRIVRYHWDPVRWAKIQSIFQVKYKKTLEKMVVAETSGEYRNLMRAYITNGHSLKEK